MRIAHIIMVHKDPLQLERLIDRLTHPQSDIYIHIDKKVDETPFVKLQDHPSVHFIKNRTRCHWGGNSLLNGIINSLREIIFSYKKYDFINLLSAQDYPLTSVDAIYKYFEDKPGVNFISYEPKESAWWQTAVVRYEKYHFTDFNFRWKYLLQRIVNRITPNRKFPIQEELYGGSRSTWWTITGACATFVIKTLDRNKRLNNFLKYCWGTDEFVIPTLIMNSPFKESVVNNNLRYIDWSEGKARPKLLTVEDFEQISTSGMLFARKFDREVDVTILDKIDTECIGI